MITEQQPIITLYNGESEEITPLAYKCKFTVEDTGTANAMSEHRRVEFEGYATPELYDALIEAVKRAAGRDVD